MSYKLWAKTVKLGLSLIPLQLEDIKRILTQVVAELFYFLMSKNK